MRKKEEERIMSTKKVFISASASGELISFIMKMGYETELIRREGIVAGPVSDHPDIFMCKLGATDEAPVFMPSDISSLRPEYPYDIAYNAACTGRYFIHNLKYTSPELLRTAEEMGMKLVNTRQGYAKCSTVIVDEESVITYDMGLARACTGAGLDVLAVQPGHVALKGYDTGFIGGASGRLGDTLVFNGDLEEHPDFDRITRFIEERGLTPKWFPGRALTDIGSIISCRTDNDQ